MSKTTKTRLYLSINSDKKQALQQWCRQRNITVSQLVNHWIDACLSGETYNFPNSPDLQTQIDSCIEKAITPLKQRIEELELKLKSSNEDNFSSQRRKDAKGMEEFEHKELPNLNDDKSVTQTEAQEERENRCYLTRHETWRYLKTTTYVQSNGYESFLTATCDELVSYGVYYDPELKRYYLK